MSRENVEVIRRVYDAVAKRDSDAVLALYDPEIEWDFTRAQGFIQPHVYRGHEGLRRFYREWREAWEYIEESADELIDAGEHVISVGGWRGRGRASGAEVEGPAHAGVWTVRNGKVVRVTWFQTRKEALEAAGLSE